jgi:hypothetical protein
VMMFRWVTITARGVGRARREHQAASSAGRRHRQPPRALDTGADRLEPEGTVSRFSVPTTMQLREGNCRGISPGTSAERRRPSEESVRRAPQTATDQGYKRVMRRLFEDPEIDLTKIHRRCLSGRPRTPLSISPLARRRWPCQSAAGQGPSSRYCRIGSSPVLQVICEFTGGLVRKFAQVVAYTSAHNGLGDTLKVIVSDTNCQIASATSTHISQKTNC